MSLRPIGYRIYIVEQSAPARPSPRALPAPPAVEAPEVWGPKKWRALHERALAWDGTRPEAEHQWIAQWLLTIPGGCTCKRKALRFLKQYPLDLSSPQAYQDWTYARHDDVNQDLGKPRLGVQAARALWKQT